MGPEQGPSSASEAQEEQINQPQKREGFLGRLGSRFRRQQRANFEELSQENQPEMPTGDSGEIIDDLREVRRTQAEVEQEALRLERNINPERLGTPNTPEDLVNLMLTIDGVAWRERKLDEKYKGGRLGAFHKFMAGERDFSLDQNGQTNRNSWNEFKRKALKVGISTAVGTTAAVGIGVATGGVGLLAFGAVFGSTAVHAGIEAWHSLNGKERGLREKIARAEWEQWDQMHRQAIQSTTETNPETKNELLENIIDTRYQTSEQIIGLEKETVAETKIWNNRRLIGKLAGGLAGAGITFGLAHLGERVMTMDIDGENGAHLVEKVGDAWHYAYNTAQEAANATAHGASLVADGLGRASHALGESGWQVALGVAKNLAPAAGALMGAVFQRGYEKIFHEPSDEQIDQKYAKKAEFDQHQSGRLKGQLPNISGVGEGAMGSSSEANIPDKYAELIQEENKSLPEVGKTWIYRDEGDLGIIKIKSLDWENNSGVFEVLDRNFQTTNKELTMNLEDVICKGFEKSEFVNNWLISVPDNGKVRVNPDQRVLDRMDPKGQRMIEGGDYTLKRIDQKPSQAELVQEGKEKNRVNIFDLAFWGVRPLEPEKQTQAEKIKAPKSKDVWARIDPNIPLPPELAQVGDRITITEVEDGVVYFQNGNQPIQNIKQFTEYFRKVGTAGGGGGGQGQGRGQGGGQGGRGQQQP